MDLKWKVHQFTYAPTDYTATVVVPIMGVKRGTWVMGADIRVDVLFDGTGPTITVGDDVAGGGDVDGLIAAADITMGAAALYHGYGAYFSGANGRLWTGDDTIDIVYTGAGDVTQGQVSVYIVYCEIE